MGLKRTDEFRKDVVRIALTSGLTRKQVAKQWVAGKRKRHSRAFDSVPFQKVREPGSEESAREYLKGWPTLSRSGKSSAHKINLMTSLRASAY